MDSFTNHERLQINKNYGYEQHVFIIDNEYNHKLHQYQIKNILILCLFIKSKKKWSKMLEYLLIKKLQIFSTLSKTYVFIIFYCLYSMILFVYMWDIIKIKMSMVVSIFISKFFILLKIETLMAPSIFLTN